MMQTVRSSLAVLVFCAYIVVNTQMVSPRTHHATAEAMSARRRFSLTRWCARRPQMMGGNKRRQMRPTDHIMAAVTLYTDILNLVRPVRSCPEPATRDECVLPLESRMRRRQFLHIVASMARSQAD